MKIFVLFQKVIISVIFSIISGCSSENSGNTQFNRPDGKGKYKPSKIVLEHMQKKDIIKAIKEIRTETGMGLAEAKAMYETIELSYKSTTPKQ